MCRTGRLIVNARVPHLRIVVGFAIAAIVGYALFCAWAVVYLDDATMLGDIGGTWKSFATAAFFFWLGSSSGGKARDPDAPTGKPKDPLHVTEDVA